MPAPPRPSAAPVRPTQDRAHSPAEVQPIADAVMALARAARSVLLYDAGNQTVQQHLAEYQARMRAAIDRLKGFALTIAPFQILAGGAVVYSEQDREKSLSFRLFRDGLRGLRIAAGAPTDELLGLLEIVAVRYTGVRQQEEDAVTLVRKAEFKSIEMEYVEGFTPAEEVPEPVLEAEIERREHHVPPATWDTPLRQLPAPAPVQYRPVPAEALARLRALDSDDAVADLAVSIADDLLAEASRGGWLERDRDLQAFLDDLRDGLLVEGKLAAVRQLHDLLVRAKAVRLRERMLKTLAHPDTIALVIAAVPETDEQLPPDALAFASVLRGAALLDALAEWEPGRRRRLVSDLVKARLPRDLDLVLSRFPQLPSVVIEDLVGTIVAKAPERAAELGQRLLAEKDEALVVVGLGLVVDAPGGVPLRRICELVRDGADKVRIRAAEVLGRRGDERVVETLTNALDRRELPDGEAEVIGRALAQVSPRTMSPLLAEWMNPKKRLLGGLTDPQRARQWAAVAGAGVLPGLEAEEALEDLASRSEGELKTHCMRTLLARRRGRARG